jgi:hypothetical protein
VQTIQLLQKGINFVADGSKQENFELVVVIAITNTIRHDDDDDASELRKKSASEYNTIVALLSMMKVFGGCRCVPTEVIGVFRFLNFKFASLLLKTFEKLKMPFFEAV